MKRTHSVSLLLILLCSALLLSPIETPALQNEAGYFNIEPIHFYFHQGSYFNRLALRSSEAQIWYSFHAADNPHPQTPIFVFFNGGPGAATSSGLMSMYTSRFTLDNQVDNGGGSAYITNPVPWTSLGHLLYIDARQTGFSYNMMHTPEDEGTRFQEFNAQNFNSFFDAADFIRVLLRFLADHPDLQDHPVVIVGESYGGIRVTTMLHILLNYDDYGNDKEVFQDPALVEEIQNHLDIVFPDHAGQVVPPWVINKQFGHQIIIQGSITHYYQRPEAERLLKKPGSPLYKIGKEVGIPYDPVKYPNYRQFVRDIAGRDVYMYVKPKDWLTAFFYNAGSLIRFIKNLSMLTGVDATAINELYASSRTRAYRIIDTDYSLSLEPRTKYPIIRGLFEIPARLEAPYVRQEPGDLDDVFGTLLPWDRFFISINDPANWAFHVWNVALFRGYDIHWVKGPLYGRMFLKNVSHVHTFITNAAYDLQVYAPAIPSALAKHTDILKSSRHIQAGSQTRPGQIKLDYKPSAFPDLPNLTTRTIRFPSYDQSGHAVSLSQPIELFTDVTFWLLKHGIEVE
jgi:hypothetical protein